MSIPVITVSTISESVTSSSVSSNYWEQNKSISIGVDRVHRSTCRIQGAHPDLGSSGHVQKDSPRYRTEGVSHSVRLSEVISQEHLENSRLTKEDSYISRYEVYSRVLEIPLQAAEHQVKEVN